MEEENEIKEINIPAYKRKRSIAAKARKKPRKTKKRSTTKKSSSKVTIKRPEILTDIPISPVLPEENLFEDGLKTAGRRPKIREMKICGRCEGYFEKINVAIIEVTSPIRTEDILLYETTDGLFEEKLKSMQIDKRDVSLARSGNSIGVKVSKKPKVGGLVYKVVES